MAFRVKYPATRDAWFQVIQDGEERRTKVEYLPHFVVHYFSEQDRTDAVARLKDSFECEVLPD